MYVMCWLLICTKACASRTHNGIGHCTTTVQYHRAYAHTTLLQQAVLYMLCYKTQLCLHLCVYISGPKTAKLLFLATSKGLHLLHSLRFQSDRCVEHLLSMQSQRVHRFVSLKLLTSSNMLLHETHAFECALFQVCVTPSRVMSSRTAPVM
jgi:hypothetical protein